jgi:hypothetical protein
MRRLDPVTLAAAPRPWLTRAPGECAFPVGGEGAAVRSCCNPSGMATYCPAHAEAMRGPAAPSAEMFSIAILAWLEGRI